MFQPVFTSYFELMASVGLYKVLDFDVLQTFLKVTSATKVFFAIK